MLLISSKGPGLGSQLKVNIPASFLTFWELDGNQLPQRQCKRMCLFNIINTYHWVNTWNVSSLRSCSYSFSFFERFSFDLSFKECRKSNYFLKTKIKIILWWAWKFITPYLNLWWRKRNVLILISEIFQLNFDDTRW